MRVLIFHGYMLRGTGSNIYNANLAPALARLGHEIHLLCQDREVELPGVTIHNPDIGGLLPVYVKDPYPGFEVKTFDELTEAELDRYIDTNVAAVRDVASAVGGIDAALANHLVMGPAILARADIAPFAAKIHGSALEYTVKPHPRFLPYAYEGMEAASGILVGSAHTAESLWRALPDLPHLKEKTRLGPPGVDVEAFQPRIAGADSWAPDSDNPSTYTSRAGLSEAGVREGSSRSELVVFVGKFIVSKGVDLLLAAWPLVHAKHPEARLRLAGFGAYEDGLRRLQAALDRGDLDDARAVAAAGRGLEGGEAKPLPILSAFLADPPPGYAEATRAAAGSVEWIGRLEHDQVAELLPRAEALVMPSTFPEAFGMVAVEAAASGALPVSAGHSGMREVSERLAAALPEPVAPLTSFPVEPGAVEAIAARLRGWLDLPDRTRAEARATLVETVARLWSWEGVARGVLDAAAGNLGGLPPAGS
ncbi:MAG TPA: glycosyltransferase family 4 protein [Solirubrobacterales bacterium]|nr:glycosyltransferase family 4 protein [Solirubrobacterales bacterium]